MRSWLALPLAASCAGSDHRVQPVGYGSAGSAGSAVEAGIVVDAAPPPDAPPPPLDRDPARLVARTIAMWQAVAAAADGSDCAAATAKLVAVRADFADVVAAETAVLADAGADARRDELKEAIAARRGELDAAAHAVFASRAVAACASAPSAPDFASAFDRAVGQP